MANFENEQKFLHALSNSIASLQGKLSLTKLKMNKLSPEELNSNINFLETKVQEICDQLAKRKEDVQNTKNH